MLRRLMVYNKPSIQTFYTRGGEDFPMMALYLPYKAIGIPHSTYVTPSATKKVHLSTLSNGIRVATMGHPSPVVSYGVYVKAGSRYENQEAVGATHFLKQMAFRTNHYRFDYRMAREIEQLGATLTISAGREYMLYTSEVPYTDAAHLPSLLREIWKGPSFLEFEVERQLPYFEQEVNELRADPQTMLMELLHRGAFRGKTLGNSLLGSPHHVENFITGNYGKAVKDYVKTFYTPQNTVIVGMGVEHEQFLDWVKPFEQEIPAPVPHEVGLGVNYQGPVFDLPDKASPTTKFPQEPSRYVGGEASEVGTHGTHVAVAFEGVPARNQKEGTIVELLKYLFGSARQHDAVGSGTKMSRLGANVVGANPWVDEALAFNIPYSDSGLFGLYAKSEHESSEKVLNVLAKEVNSVVKKGVDEKDINRAKAYYKNDLVEQKRLPTLQFIGQQLFSGTEQVLTPEEYRGLIDNITAADVNRIIQKVFNSNPTVAAIGDLTGVLSPSEVRNIVTSTK